MPEIFYLNDPTSIQDEIDEEDVTEAFKQRLLQDPRVNLQLVADIMKAQGEGKSLLEAVNDAAPELLQPVQNVPPEAGALGPEGQPATPEEQQATLAAGATNPQALAGVFQPPPLQQQIVRGP